MVGGQWQTTGLALHLKKATLLTFNFPVLRGVFWLWLFFFFSHITLFYFIRGVRSLGTLCKISQFVQHLERPATHMSWLIYDQMISFDLEESMIEYAVTTQLEKQNPNDRNRQLKTMMNLESVPTQSI